MFLKLCVFLFIIHVSVEQIDNQDWDLAVTINDQIELLTANGTLLGATLSFSRLKALTFDNIRHQFVASDMNQENDTIYSIPLTEAGNDNIPIVEDLPDDIQGLAIDPLTDILYWTDPKHKSINSVPLNKPLEPYNIFMKFEDVEPQDLAIDSCRRYIYFTNSYSDKPSINRIHLETKQHQVLVDSNLHTPVGIAIDYVAKKLYWSDSGPGIYFSIESSNLEGKERQIVITDTHQHPFGLAVDTEFIYWTDINNNALWRRRKNYEQNENGIYKLKHFEERPQGLIAKHLGFAGTPDCDNIMQLFNEYNETTTEYYQALEIPENVTGFCLNNGHENADGCECRRGYKGRYCEISLCYNYCLHGRCGLTKQGYPKCYCNTGFNGPRCESNICDTYCLNNGTCKHSNSEIWGAKCLCREGFFGDRCEMNVEMLCNKVCKNEDVIPREFNNFMCICDGEKSTPIKIFNENATQIPNARARLSAVSIGEHFKDPTFLILSACMLASLSVTVALMVYVCKMKKRRPRVNKRIIVNKNVTPLTYRPQPATQECEITIENCCNMNVCETPCFEPPQLRRKTAKDEKKKLLTNMENPDELC